MSYAKENLKYHFLLFILSPILGLIYGIKSRQEQTIRWSIFAFVAIYGSLFHDSFLGDGAVHWRNVYDHYSNLDFSVFWEELKAMMSFQPKQTTNDDPYIHFLSYFVGTILDAPRLFFVFVAIVYAYFYSGVIVKLLSYANWKSKYNKFYFTFFLILFILWLPPLRMQTVRTWTGLWVLLYGLLYYHETKKLKYMILILAPPLIHVGYYALAIPIWIVFFSNYRNPKVYFIIFIISMFVSTVASNSSVQSTLTQSELGSSKVQGYYDDGTEEKALTREREDRISNARFYRRFESLGLHTYGMSGLIIFMFVFLSRDGFGKFENTLFSYGLAMAAFSNFFTQIFAIHNRGWEIAGVLILALFVIFLSKQNLNKNRLSFLKVKLPLFLFSLFMFPYTLYLISNSLSFTSPFLLILPVVNWFEYDIGTNLRELIGIIL